MDVNMDTIASQGIALNKAQAGADILQKTLKKTEEARNSNQSVERPESTRVMKGEGRVVNTYA
ncbi:MAG TPA: hypothetical protein ENK84_11665 [Desulfobulbus sp.]|nr:hypothetical protein [Desulfobulbus sp.]HHD63528.1 hypothetical protein [Desulfobulbaceae bacterium]